MSSIITFTYCSKWNHPIDTALKDSTEPWVWCFIHIRFMLYVISVMFSSGPLQVAVTVFGYIEGSFLVVRTGDARERHAPNIYRCMTFARITISDYQK